MEREYFVRGFARRLVALMQKENLVSSQSKSGVQIGKLAKITGCSQQMARRYALGEALPDIQTVYTIAKWLNVSPGWLLYGEEGDVPHEGDIRHKVGQNNVVYIAPELLQHILSKCIALLDMQKNKQEWVSYVLDVIRDTAQLNVAPDEVLKIVDLSIKSILRFHGRKNDEQTHIS